MNIGIIGEGHLGTLLRERLSIARPNVWSINRNRWATEGAHFVQKMDLLLIAVRPSDLQNVMFTIRANADKTPVISFAAGVRSEDYKYKNLYRAMTNIGIARGKANTMVLLPKHITQGLMEPKFSNWEDFANVQEILFELGDLVVVGDGEEHLLDVHTIIAGSGVAFAAHLQQIWIEWAIGHGMQPDMAANVVAQVFSTTSELIYDEEIPVQDIIDEVATAGGTTAAGLEVLEGNNPEHEAAPGTTVESMLHDAFDFAINRNKEISEDGIR